MIEQSNPSPRPHLTMLGEAGELMFIYSEPASDGIPTAFMDTVLTVLSYLIVEVSHLNGSAVVFIWVRCMHFSHDVN